MKIFSTSILSFLFFFSFLEAQEKLLKPEFQAHYLLEKKIQTWIKQLEKNPEDEKVKANLLKIGAIAGPYLLSAMQSNEMMFKRQIIDILSSLKIKKAEPLLVQCLMDEKENPRVREAAASSLEIFRSAHAMQALSKLSFDKDARIHRAASYALCRINIPRAIPYLIPLLKHWDESIRNKSYLSLVKVTGQNLPNHHDVWQKWWSDYKDILEEHK